MSKCVAEVLQKKAPCRWHPWRLGSVNWHLILSQGDDKPIQWLLTLFYDMLREDSSSRFVSWVSMVFFLGFDRSSMPKNNKGSAAQWPNGPNGCGPSEAFDVNKRSYAC